MDIKQRAARARELLNNPAFIDMMTILREEQVKKFLSSAPNDADAREQAHSIVNALQTIEDYLKSHITDEKMFDKKRN